MSPSPKRSEEDELGRILAELDTSKAAYLNAVAAVRRAIQIGRDIGFESPDGSLGLKKANQAEEQAREQYRAAIAALNRHVKRNQGRAQADYGSMS